MDVNGDGLIDLFEDSTYTAGTFLLGTGTGFVTEDSTRYTSSWAAILWSTAAQGFTNGAWLSIAMVQGPLNQLIDINGDGKPDEVISDPSLMNYFMDRKVSPPGSCQQPDFDAIYTPDEYWVVFLNTGTGFDYTNGILWNAAETTNDPNAPYEDFGFVQETSGPDFVCVGVRDHVVHGWTRLVDFDASGSPDFVQVAGGTWNVFQNPGPKAELLTTVDNGFGAETSITWSTINGARSSQQGQTGSGQFPVNVVYALYTTNGINDASGTQSQYTTFFDYYGMFFDSTYRTFRGFRRVDVTTFDNLGGPTALSEHFFNVGDATQTHAVHLGALGSGCSDNSWTDSRALAGTEFDTLTGPDAGTLLHEEATGWSVATPTGAPATAIAPLLKINRHLEFAGSSVRMSEVKHQYDDLTWGDEDLTTDNGEVSASGCTETVTTGNDEVTSYISQFSRNTTAWISLPADAKKCADGSACATLLAETTSYYDGSSTLGASPTYGEPTMVQLRADPLPVPTGFFQHKFTLHLSVFDGYGNVTETQDKLSGVEAGCATSLCTKTDYVYGSNTHAFPTQTTRWYHKQPSGALASLVTNSIWDERFGVATQITDPNGRVSYRSYDALGRLSQETSTPPSSPTGTVATLATYSYSTGGATGATTSNYIDKLAHVSTSGGVTIESRVYYDGFLRPIQEKKQAAGTNWATTSRRYSRFGKPDADMLPYFDSSIAYALPLFSLPPNHSQRTTTFDWSGRPTATALQSSNFGTLYYSTSHSYSLWEETVTNPRSNQTLYRHDAHGHLSYVEERSGSTMQAATNFAYDRPGNLVSVTDNGGHVTTMTYDTLGRKLTMVDPDMSNCSTPANCAWKYTYNLVGNMTSQIDAAAQETDFNFDELGRNYLTHYNCAGCEDDSWFDFDAPGALGLPTDAIKGPGDLSGGGSTSNSTNYAVFAYDNWGRAIQVTKIIAGESKAAQTNYDLLGRTTSVTYPTGEVASYSFGPEGGVEQLTFAGAPIISSAQYDALLRPSSITWGNGLTSSTVYGDNEKVQSSTVGTLLNLGYAYDADGNTQSVTESVGAWSRGYGYDWADRLTSAQEPSTGTPTQLWTYTYDPIGNMTFNSDWAGSGMDGTYVYGAAGGTGPAGPHAATLIGGTGTSSPYRLTYDPNGDVISETTGLAYAYNRDGKLKTTSDSGAPINPNAAFTYDASGDRVLKTWTSPTGSAEDLRYFGSAFEELRDGGVLHQDRYVMVGSARVALLPSSGTSAIFFLHPDVQGTVSLVTDRTGAVVERERFRPYGGPWAQSGTTPQLRYGFTGQELDGESGQIHLGVRELHFTIGRMLQPDSIVPDAMHPQSLNHYAYALNNPVRYVDPSGFVSQEAKGGGCDTSHAQTDCDKTSGSLDRISDAAGYLQLGIVAADALSKIGAMIAELPVIAETGDPSLEEEAFEGLGADLTEAESVVEGGGFGGGSGGISGGDGGAGGAGDGGGIPALGNSLPGHTNPAGVAGADDVLAIGKVSDLSQPGALRNGEVVLDLPDQGSPQANWTQNSSQLRSWLSTGKPIRDVTGSDPETGALLRNDGFLRMERNLLIQHGLEYDPNRSLWTRPR